MDLGLGLGEGTGGLAVGGDERIDVSPQFLDAGEDPARQVAGRSIACLSGEIPTEPARVAFIAAAGEVGILIGEAPLRGQYRRKRKRTAVNSQANRVNHHSHLSGYKRVRIVLVLSISRGSR
jgi:hypothetical protein